MKLAIIASTLATAAAFAPAQTGSASAALQASKFANEIGAQAPLGFWDPLKLCEDADQEKFDNLRYVELKHGRVSMLAFTGYVVTGKLTSMCFYLVSPSFHGQSDFRSSVVQKISCNLSHIKCLFLASVNSRRYSLPWRR
jgi:hypothetical protein